MSSRNKASYFLWAAAHSLSATRLSVFFEGDGVINKWMLSSLKSTTAPRATGKASLPSKNYRTAQKSLKKPPRSGSSNKPFGRSISSHRDTFHSPNSTYHRLTRSTKQTFFFCLMTSSLVAAKFINTRLLLSTSAAVTKRQSLLSPKTLRRLQ